MEIQDKPHTWPKKGIDYLLSKDKISLSPPIAVVA
jgi:hypothetical protein